MGKYQSIVILTGAGVSAESGLKTFRASDGLWEDHRVEDVATPEAFNRDPELVQRFYNTRRQQLLSPETQPNSAHRALARLEQDFPGSCLLVTQNIDDLHERAGSQQLIHMHGELLKSRCVASGRIFPVTEDMDPTTQCSCCGQPGNMRPDIVWFGEMPMQMERIYDHLEDCDLFISVGTSGAVYPAAGFVQAANMCGAHTVELNLEPSKVQSAFSEQIYGPASEVVPAYVEQLLADL
ncbi:MAG: NAD-dependent protein deacylase [Motiliproteus sp.]|nr:NAD-dependent protein deacylase [Motiliproteus sp.]MCW9051625.1 NAD-dependent protein deacylase [Motiliproteus sp.]